MDARFIQRGDAIDYTPATDVAAGDVVILEKLVGIAKLDVKAGELGALAVTGVFEVTKGSVAFTAGAEVGWDAEAKQAVAADGAAVKIGHAVAGADTSAETVLVRLCQGL